MRTLEKFEITDASREALERHVAEIYKFLQVDHGRELKNCDYICGQGRVCRCYESGSKDNECDGECGAYDDGFADGKNEAKWIIPDPLIAPIQAIRSARSDAILKVGVSNLNDEVDRFIAILNHSFHI